LQSYKASIVVIDKPNEVPLRVESPRFLGHNLSTFLVSMCGVSRYHEGMEVNIFELFYTRAGTIAVVLFSLYCIVLYCIGRDALP
jgi:hypothetical protein